jgi:hypothetical protein
MLRRAELRHTLTAAWLTPACPRICAFALLAFAPFLATGCHSSLAKNSAALATATAPVVDQAAAAYVSANAIHNIRQDYDALVAFDAPPPAPAYNPRSIKPLLTDKDIEVRLTVLAAFQEYVKSLVAITSGTDSPELREAAKTAGENLASLGNTVIPSIQAALNIAPAVASTTQTTVTTTTGNTTTSTTSTSTTAAPAISSGVQNGITTAIDALGQFLINRRIEKGLPRIIAEMDPHVKTLCALLVSDVAILTDQENRDYNVIINQQTQFVMATKNLDPGQRRDLIMKLPGIVRQQQLSSEALQHLSASIQRLEVAHDALAADAAGKTPESLKQKMGDLEAAGSGLGNFYTSLKN